MSGSEFKIAGALAGMLAALAGCRPVGPNYKPPAAPTPDVWHQKVAAELGREQPALQAWWRNLNDPVLTSLVDEARNNNLTAQQALSVIRESRLRRAVVSRNLQPVVDISGSYSRAKASSQDPLFSKLPNVAAQPFNLFTVGFDVIWEADVFGGIRRSIEAADAGVGASLETYRDVLVTLFAEVALNYVDLRTFQQRIAYAEANVKIQTESLALARSRFESGLTGRLDLEQARSNLSNTRAILPALKLGEQVVLNQLAFLLSVPPTQLRKDLEKPGPIPSAPEAVAVGLPADLLRQRPDVRRAERFLALQTARVGVATAQLYPRFGLSGNLGLQTVDISKFSGAGFFGITPFFRWNIFNRGRLHDLVKAEKEVTQQALLGYQNTVLLALAETESAMVAFHQEKQRLARLREAVAATEKAVGLVRTLYNTGLSDFQNVLDTERTLFLQQDNLAVSEGQVTKNLISLYKALGGGWSLSALPEEAKPQRPGEESQSRPEGKPGP